MYALIDCNNFYVSCERAFQPALQNKAGVVLSNNDGCAIARSEEAKLLSVRMGTPFFEIQQANIPVWVRSSNYPLYQDMMLRVTSIIRRYFPDQEIYSIDECFCDLNGYHYLSPEQLAHQLRADILQSTGIPVCIGIARTKTLAKFANRLAKKSKDAAGVYFLSASQEPSVLKQLTVKDIWGIGRQHSQRLEKIGVQTAYDFTRLSRQWVQKHMSIVGVRTWQELQGVSCIPMEYIREAKKGIGTSRSFGKAQTEIAPMLEALSTYISHAAYKLRRQNSVCSKIYVYAHTSGYIPEQQQSYIGLEVKLPTPTADSSELVKIGKWILRKTFRSGYRYIKVGVDLRDICPDDQVQQSLFDTQVAKREKMLRAMQAMDKINNKEGRETIRLASSGYEKKWAMRQEFRSPAFTTRIADIIKVKAI